MKQKFRKPRPQPPRWYWADSDGCWNCPDRNNCSGCKKLKRVNAKQKERKRNHQQSYKYADMVE